MTDIQVQHLMTKRFEYSCDRDIQFSKRITDRDHIFESTKQAICYIGTVVNDNPYCFSSVNFISYRQSPVFAINIIDEGLCTILYSIFQFRRNDNKDELVHTSTLLEELFNEIQYKYDKLISSNHKYENDILVISKLKDIIMNIHDICFPADEVREEDFLFKLSDEYYRLMYFLYDNITTEDVYYCTKMQERYRKLIY